MTTLEKTINDLAWKKFQEDAKDYQAFMYKHAKLGEFVEYVQRKGWLERFSETKVGNMKGLAESFNKEVLWLRMKEEYVKGIISMLESKLEPSIEININYNN